MSKDFPAGRRKCWRCWPGGSTNKEIGEMLVISEHTARNHVCRILDKLGLSRRSEAAVFAAEHGLLGSTDHREP